MRPPTPEQIHHEIELLRREGRFPRTIRLLEWVLGIYPLSPSQQRQADRWPLVAQADDESRTRNIHNNGRT